MKWLVSFYNEKVERRILDYPRGIYVRFLKLLEIMESKGANIGEPHTKSLGDGLFEIRVKAKEGLGRFFYCTLVDKEIVILHSFIKKTQHIPKKELDVAKKRMKEVKLS